MERFQGANTENTKILVKTIWQLTFQHHRQLISVASAQNAPPEIFLLLSVLFGVYKTKIGPLSKICICHRLNRQLNVQ